MRVFVTGATGSLGRALVPELRQHGHDVVGLARTTASRSMLHAMHASAYSGQGFDVDRLADALVNIHAVVHLATTIPTSDTAVEDDWAYSPDIVVGLLRNLLTASERSGVRTVIFPSFYGVYGDHGDRWVTEKSTPKPNAATRPFVEAERLLLSSTTRRKSSGVILRMGMCYTVDASHTKGLLYGLEHGQVPLISGGQMYWPQIHAADAAQAIRLAMEHSPVGEVVNVCDDEPVRQVQLFRDLARWVGGPSPPSEGVAVVNPYMGCIERDALLFSVRMSNGKVRDALGFKPQYPTYREGYEAVVGQWKEAGVGK